MNCVQTRRFLDAYVDAELEPSEVLRIETHLVECAACAERARLTTSMKRSVRASAAEMKALASLRARIAATRERSGAQIERARERTRRPSWQSAMPWLGAAAAAVAFGGGAKVVMGERALGGGSTSASIAAAELEDFASQHARPLPPEEIDPERIRRVFSPIVGVPVRPVSFGALAAMGARAAGEVDGEAVIRSGNYQFAGARLVPVHDEPTATLTYEGRGNRVTVFVFDPHRITVESSCCMKRKVIRHHDADKTVYFGRAKNGYALAVAENEGVGYAVSGDLAEPEIVSIASEL